MENGDLGWVRLAVDTGRGQPRAKGAGSPLSHLESPGNCPEVTPASQGTGWGPLGYAGGGLRGVHSAPILFIRRNPTGTPEGSFAPKKVCWRKGRGDKMA